MGLVALGASTGGARCTNRWSVSSWLTAAFPAVLCRRRRPVRSTGRSAPAGASFRPVPLPSLASWTSRCSRSLAVAPLQCAGSRYLKIRVGSLPNQAAVGQSLGCNGPPLRATRRGRPDRCPIGKPAMPKWLAACLHRVPRSGLPSDPSGL